MKRIPLTILAFEGPQARAYLSRMQIAGLIPERIILMVMDRHPSTKKPIGRLLPSKMRVKYARKVQEISHNHWPCQIKREFPTFVKGMLAEIKTLSPHAEEIVQRMTQPFRYEDYAETVEPILTSGFSDPHLRNGIQNLSPTTILFTGGGILTAPLLSLPGIKFIHVHPGYLPHVRGADGMLWSLLVRKKFGMSAFYMAPGIDEGDILARREYDPISFPKEQIKNDDALFYRSIFSFLDPVLRAEFLVSEVLLKNGDKNLSTLPGIEQKETEGITYHFMNPKLLHPTLGLLFRSTHAA